MTGHLAPATVPAFAPAILPASAPVSARGSAPASTSARSRFRGARSIAAVALALAATAAPAQQYKAGDIDIRHPYATPTRPGAVIGAAYFGGLENRSGQPDRLLRARSPVAERVELHSGDIGTDGVMRMRELDNLPLPPRKTLEMKPGQGNHLMLIDLRKPLTAGESFPMTLEFERGGTVEVKVEVQEAAAAAKHSGHGH
jgi:copper(I)-binding protein